MKKNEEKSSLSIYYDSLKNFPPLTEMEERKLLNRYKKKNDIVARQKLINHNLRYALKYAMEYSNKNNEPLDDTIQLANIGLIEAIEKFDLNNENRITTYANWRMLYSIQSGLEDKVMDNVVDEYDLTRTKDDNIGEDEGLTSNEPFDDDNNINVDNVTLDDYFSFENDKNIALLVKSLLSELDEREYDMMTMYYGINENEKSYTLDEIGKKHGLTKERVRQIIEKCKRKMRIKALVENKKY